MKQFDSSVEENLSLTDSRYRTLACVESLKRSDISLLINYYGDRYIEKCSH